MDKNTVIGILLIGAIIITFSILNKPSEEEREQALRRRDSLERIQHQREIERIKAQEQAETTQVVISQDKSEDDLDTSVLKNRYGVFAQAAVGEQSYLTIENDLIKVVISTKGGRPYSVELKKYKTYDIN